jgi:hypothetical protein
MLDALKPAERRNGTAKIESRWPDMTGLAMSRSHRLYLRDDPQRARRRAVEIHLRRRHRHVRLSRQPALGFWQQPVGAGVTARRMGGLIVAMFVTLWIVGGGYQP